MSREFLNLEEVAAWLGKDRRTVEKLVQRGILPARRIAGEWRFHTAEITPWAEQDLRTLDATELAAFENSQKSPELDQQSPLKTLLHTETCETQLDAGTKPAVLQALWKSLAEPGKSGAPPPCSPQSANENNLCRPDSKVESLFRTPEIRCPKCSDNP